jgi:hypothetical protein
MAEASGHAVDSAGKYNSIIEDELVYSQSGPPNSGNCFNLSSDSCHFGTAVIRDLDGASEASFGLWVKWEIPSYTGLGSYLFTKNAGELTNLLSIFPAAVTGKLQWIVKDTIIRSAWVLYADLNLVVGTWYHFLWVFNGNGAGNTDRIKFYVNNVPITLTFGDNPQPAVLPDMQATGLYIGSRSSGSGVSWKSYLDEIDVMSLAISDSERDAMWKNMNDPNSFGTLQQISSSYFSVGSVTDDVPVQSIINGDALVSAIQTNYTDPYFDSTSKFANVNIYYTHSDGRQIKRIVHKGDPLIGNTSWSQYTQDGTWTKGRIVVCGYEGEFHDLPRSVIGSSDGLSSEDITYSDGTMNLNIS